jgi:hypothetical protein
MELKVGDIVRYVNHSIEADSLSFTKGEVYKVERTYGRLCFLVDIDSPVFDFQVQKIHDTKLNRVLYPEYFEVKDD